MGIKISGVLPCPTGEPAVGATIILRAITTSTAVIQTLESTHVTDSSGKYQFEVEAGQYDVTLWMSGINGQSVGTITVYRDSSPGTLQEYLTALTEDQATPELIKYIEQLRNQAQQSQIAAKASESLVLASQTAAKTSETNSKTSETAAKNSQTAAATSASNADNSAKAAKVSETNAKTSETAAKLSQTAAASSQTAANASETAAAGSATKATTEADRAKKEADRAKSVVTLDPEQTRTDLGLGNSATLNVGNAANTVAAGDDERITGAVQKSQNLADVPDKSQARANLGLGNSSNLNVGTAANTVAAGDDGRITGAAQNSSNLSDLTDKAAARKNLQLKNAAVQDIGTTAGTVAAGDDGRIVNALQKGQNLDDLTDKNAARNNIGAYPVTGGPLNGAIDATGHISANGIITSNGWMMGMRHDSRQHFGMLNADGSARMWMWKEKGGAGVYINNGDDGGRNFLFSNDGALYVPTLCSARFYHASGVGGGTWNSWAERTAAVMVDCPNAWDLAYSIWKATHHNRGYIAAMDVHWARSDIAYVRLVCRGHAYQWDSNGDFSIPRYVYAQGFNQTSDIRHKKNITSITDATKIIKSWHGKKWQYQSTGMSSAGLIAQDVCKKLPEAISRTEDGTLTLNYSATIGVLVEALKEVLDKIDNQEERITQLEGQLELMSGAD